MSQNILSAPSRGFLFALALIAAVPAAVVIGLAAHLNWGR